MQSLAPLQNVNPRAPSYEPETHSLSLQRTQDDQGSYVKGFRKFLNGDKFSTTVFVLAIPIIGATAKMVEIIAEKTLCSVPGCISRFDNIPRYDDLSEWRKNMALALTGSSLVLTTGAIILKRVFGRNQ